MSLTDSAAHAEETAVGLLGEEALRRDVKPVRQGARPHSPQSQGLRSRLRALVPYGFIAPKLALFAVFMLVPLVWAVVLSMQGGGTFATPHFVGLHNFRTSLADPLFWLSVRNTLLYAVLVIPLTMGLGVFLAAKLNQRIRFKKVYGLLFIIPTVISPVGASIIWNSLLMTDGGPFNRLLGLVHLGPVNWLGTPALLIPIFVLLELWRGTGFYVIIFLAAMQNIPRSLYDAVAIDGASRRQAFRLITWPLIRPAVLFSVVLATIVNLQLFDSPFVMTKGGPGYASMTVVMYIYLMAFRYDAMGVAAAMSMFLLLVILVISGIQLVLFRKEIEY